MVVFIGYNISDVYKNMYIKIGRDIYKIITPVNAYKIIEYKSITTSQFEIGNYADLFDKEKLKKICNHKVTLFPKEYEKIFVAAFKNVDKIKILKMVGFPVKINNKLKIDKYVAEVFKDIETKYKSDVNLTSFLFGEDNLLSNDITSPLIQAYEKIKYRYSEYYYMFFSVDSVVTEGLSKPNNTIVMKKFLEEENKEIHFYYKKSFTFLAKLYDIIIKAIVRNEKVKKKLEKFIISILDFDIQKIMNIAKNSKLYLITPEAVNIAFTNMIV